MCGHGREAHTYIPRLYSQSILQVFNKNSLGPRDFHQRFPLSTANLFAMRLYRYFKPRASGTLKCSPEALKMWKTDSGRDWVQTCVPAYINPQMTWYILHDMCMHALYIKSHVYAEVKSSSACLPNMGHLMPWRWPSKKRPSRARKTQRKVAGFQPLLSGETRAGHRPSPSCCFQKNGAYTFLQQSTDIFVN